MTIFRKLNKILKISPSFSFGKDSPESKSFWKEAVILKMLIIRGIKSGQKIGITLWP